MNCHSAREQIADTLAAGRVELARELTGHVQSCAGCRSYTAQQAELFRAMDSGLRAMANEAMPASLLPRVRARMEEKVSRRGWLSSPLTAAVAMAVVLLAVIFFSRVAKQPLEMPVAAVPALRKDRPEPHQHGESATTATVLPREPKVIHAKASRAADDKEIVAAPEVLVLRQEREAFARFLAELPKEREVAVALTQAAPQKDEQPVEIAGLQIDELKVKPLDSTASDRDLN
jgi:hypothetical protein